LNIEKQPEKLIVQMLMQIQAGVMRFALAPKSMHNKIRWLPSQSNTDTFDF
jgi:hypothetical protein